VTTDQSAIDALKDKIAQFKAASAAKDEAEYHAPDADLIALANVGNGKVAHYVWKSINTDWNPLDHPRDPNTGEFIKSPGGYIFGKAKTAKFKGLVAKEINLGPGDVAFKTNLGNILVSHPDGSYTLHHKQDGKAKVSKVPAGAVSKIAQMSQDGELEKIGENPGVAVPAKSKTEAAFKLEHPSEGVPHDLPKDKQTTSESAWDIEKPTLKAGKTAFTAKQYAEYQEAVKGLPMGKDGDGNTITAGSWVDVEGKPYLIWPSPHDEGSTEVGHQLSVYRWVSTKQQASNLVKENFFTSNDFPDMKVIPDPTGKPYGKDLTEVTTDAPKAGALMQQAAAVSIPNTSTAHKKHVADKKGTILADASNVVLGDINGKAIASGDWMQIDGKPVQVHDSPNEGYVAIAKWVGTKKQASNNTYDFPEEIVSSGVVIPDPTGKDYTPVEVKKKPQVAKKSAAGSPAAKKAVSKPPAEPTKTGKTGKMLGQTWEQYSDGEWHSQETGEILSPGSSGAQMLEGGQEAFAADTITKIIEANIGDAVTFKGGSEDKQYTKVAEDFWESDSGNSFKTEDILNEWSEEDFANADFTPAEPESEEDFGTLPTQEESEAFAALIADLEAQKTYSTLQVIATDKPELGNYTKAIFVKQPDGAWADNLNNLPTAYTSAELANLLQDPIYKKGSTSWDGNFDNPLHDPSFFDNAQVGDQVTETGISDLTKGKQNVWIKQPDGDWKSNQTGGTVGSSTLASAFKNADEQGEKSNWKYEFQSKADVEAAAAEKDFKEEPLADWEKELLGITDDEPDPVPTTDVFVHPVSGATFDLSEANGTVYKNKKVENSWIIVTDDPETPYNYFTSTGKLQKPKASHKGFDDNYVIDENFPGQQEGDQIVPGQPVNDPDLIDNAPAGTVAIEQGAQAYNAGNEVTYVKQENGFWKTVNDGWEGPLDGNDAVSNNNFNWIVYPPGTHDLNKTKPGPPIAETETEVKPVVKGKKAVKGKEVLPTDFTLPNGKKIVLKPGESLVKAEIPEGYSNGPTTYYFVAKPGAKVYNDAYNGAGEGVSGPYAFYNTTPAAFKKYVKGTEQYHTGHGAASFELIAEKPVLKVEAVDFSVYDDGTKLIDFSDHDNDKPAFWHASNAYAKIKNQWIDPITTNITYYNGNHYGGGSIPKAEDPDQSVSWNNASMDDKLAFVSNMEQTLGKAVALMSQVDDLDIADKSQKTKATKFKNSLINAHRFTQIAQAYQDPEASGWDDDRFEQELAWAQKVSSSKAANFNELRKVFPAEGFYQLFIAAEAQRKFKNNLTDLDFDPYNSTTEEYDKFAKEKGFTALPALSPDQQKLWVLNSIGDPSLTPQQKNEASTLAQAAQTKLNIATFAATVEKNDAAFKAEEGGTKGAAIKAQLKTEYKITTDKNVVSFKYLSPNEWEWLLEDTDTGGFITQPNANDGIVAAVVNASLSNGDEVETSDKLAYGQLFTDAEKFKAAQNDWYAAHGIDPNTLGSINPNPDVEAVLVSAGANFPKAVIPSNTLRRWVRYEVEGDYIGQFALENALYAANGQEHPKALSHPGSPQSPIGQIAHKALALQALQHPEGVDWLTGKSVYWNELSEHLGVVGITAEWKAEHDPAVIAAFAAGSAEYGTANKPVDVGANVWNITNALDPSSDYATLLGEESWNEFKNQDEAALDQKLLMSAGKNLGYNSLTVPGIPLHLKKVAAWALGANSQETERKQFASAIIAKAKAGEFLTDKTPVWVSPNGDKYPISPGGQVYKSGDDSFMLTGPVGTNGKPSTGFNFVAGQSSPQPVSSYTLHDPAGYGWELVFTMPNPITWEKAKSDNPSLDQSIYDLSTKIENGESYQFNHHLSGPLLTAELKKNQTLKDKYPNLYANHKSLPEHIRQAVMSALEQGNSPLLQVMDYKAQAGHYASMSSKGLFDASQPWIPHLSKGQLESDDVLNHWTPAAKDAFVSYFKLSSHDDIAKHLDSMLNPEQVVVSKALPKLEDLQLTYVKDKSALGGMHSGGIWVDQDGNEWMTKGFASDPNGPARVDAEDAANRIALLYGFDAPTTYALNIKDITGGKDKKYSYLQHLKPASGDFVGKSVKNLTTKQMQQAMSEHVIDWITSNHDTHQNNLMLTPEGKVFGIDKGQAFKHFPNDKLAVGYLPPENGAPVWYDKFYNALTSGQISKEQADEVTKYVLRMAQKISKDKDDEYRALLDHALKNRQNFPDQYPSKEQFIDALVERKHNTFNDFVALYEGLYKQSPYEWDIDPENLTPPSLGDGQVHIAVSQSFADDVVKANAYGKALFFDSTDLEDSHVMFSKVTGPNGKPWLTGEAKVRKNGDKKLTEWLQKQTVEHKVSPGHVYNNKQGYAYYETGPDYEDMPMSANWFSSMVAYSKTVSSHNKSGDKEYNKGTVATAEAVQKQLTSVKAALTQWKSENPDKPFSGTVASFSSDNGNGNTQAFNVNLVTIEQQDAWEAMIDTYLGYYEKVKVKEGTDEKVTPHFIQPTYTASDAAKKSLLNQGDDDMPKTSLEAPVGTIVKSGSYKYTKTDDETWVNDGGSEFTIQALQDAWKYMTLEKLGEPVNEPEADEDDVLTTAEVQVGTKVLKVIYRLAASKSSSLNTATGEAVVSNETSETSAFDFGKMYEIDFGNSVIEYRPWNGSDVAPAQQGLLKFRKKDWDGDSDSIDEILDVLRHVGLDLDPANEEALELFYYRHLSAQIGDRSEGKSGTGKYGSAYQTIKQQLQSQNDLSNAEELAVHKAAWENALGADVVEKIDWLPKFSRLRPQVAEGTDDEPYIGTGRPYWTRPTTSYKDLRQIYGGGSKLPMSSMHKIGDALKIAKSGTYMSSEERYRLDPAGFKEGMSSSQDATNHGSSAVVYIRQGLSFNESGHESAFFHPKILMRTHNYAFAGDSYGDNDKKKNSPWDIKSMSKFTGGGNELMVKNALSVLDDILFIKFHTEADRKEAIAFYKSLGITMIHGIPIEKLFRTDMYDSEVQQITKQVWDQLVEEEEKKA
jgi:hypothetical protein